MQVDKIIKPAKIIDNIRSPFNPLFSCRINFCTVWILDKRFAIIASNAIFTINAYTISLIDTYPSSCLSFTILFTIQECLGILAARCASCNCMTYFYCAPLQVYTPFRSAQNHCPPDNVRPAGGYISWGIDSTTDTSLFLTIYRAPLKNCFCIQYIVTQNI